MQVIQKRKHLNKPRRRRRVRDEMRVLASLRHPNIIPLLAVYETPTDLLLLMERAQVYQGGREPFVLTLALTFPSARSFDLLLAPPLTPHGSLYTAQGGELFDRIVARGSFTEKEAATVRFPSGYTSVSIPAT